MEFLLAKIILSGLGIIVLGWLIVYTLVYGPDARWQDHRMFHG